MPGHTLLQARFAIMDTDIREKLEALCGRLAALRDSL
jgi:hypothetical protein